MSSQTEIRHEIGAEGMLLLRGVSGSINLIGGDGTEAVVLARSGRGGTPDLNVERRAGSLLVEPQRSGFAFIRGQDGEIDFTVTVPRGARVDVKSVSADINSGGLRGEQEYKTVSGDLRLRESAGRVTILTVSGDIRLERAGQLELSAATTSGDLAVEAELLELLRVRTVSGDVRLTGRLSGGPRHTVETVSGDLTFRSTGGVTVEPSRALDIGRNSRRAVVIGDGRANLSFRSMSGEERVTGPAETPARTTDAPPMFEEEPATSQVPIVSRPMRSDISAEDRLDVLRALERGDIDIEEAARRLEEVGVDA